MPDAFPYLLMKLHAFFDRKGDADKSLGRHHALDAYAIVGMMTEAEYERAQRSSSAHREHPALQQARGIVREDFASFTSLGVLRIREHPLCRPDFQLTEFLAILHELFPQG